MPRPKRPLAYEQFKVSLPPELSGELRLRCFSPVHVYGAPKGAISALFETALREYFMRNPLRREERDETQSPAQTSHGSETAAQDSPGGE